MKRDILEDNPKLQAVYDNSFLSNLKGSTDDFYGKTLLLQEVLKGMDADKANKFMYDTLSILVDTEL